MFNFAEELKRFTPSADADSDAAALSGDPMTDLKTLLADLTRRSAADLPQDAADKFEQMGLEDVQ